MTLAAMLSTDKDALICDLAETYHVLDYEELPLERVAVLASGLRGNSRIRLEMAGKKYIPFGDMVAHIADDITLLRKELAGDSSETVLFTDVTYGKVLEKQGKGFDSGEDFMRERNRILGGE